jgi:hypothetical protein
VTCACLQREGRPGRRGEGGLDERDIGGRESGAALDRSAPSAGSAGGGAAGIDEGRAVAAARARLNSRQHGGQRHSSASDPSGRFWRVSRHPNCALMSV